MCVLLATFVFSSAIPLLGVVMVLKCHVPFQCFWCWQVLVDVRYEKDFQDCEGMKFGVKENQLKKEMYV